MLAPPYKMKKEENRRQRSQRTVLRFMLSWRRSFFFLMAARQRNESQVAFFSFISSIIITWPSLNYGGATGLIMLGCKFMSGETGG